MKKTGIIIVMALSLFFAMNITAYAAEEEDQLALYEAQMEAAGGDQVRRDTPQSARELMDKLGIDKISPQTLLKLNPSEFLKLMWLLLMDEIRKPVSTLAVLCGIILLCTLLNGMKLASWDKALTPVFNMVAVLCMLTAVAKPILDCIHSTSKAIQDCSLFMLSFIPIFSTAVAAGGQPATAATYNLFLFSTCQVISQIVAQTLVPLLGIYLALCIVGAFVPELNVGAAASMIKSLVNWSLGLMLTIFVALMTMQGSVSSGLDGVTVKATKFLIGSFVPVVGSALSEAFNAAQGCLRLVRATLGVYGILAALLTFLPIFLQTAVWYWITNICSVISESIGAKEISSLLKACSGVLGILVAIIIAFALLIIVSTAIIMSFSMGVA